MTFNRRTPGAHWGHRPLSSTKDSTTLRRLLTALNRHYPIDFATISRTVTDALTLQLPLPARAWVDVTTLKLRGHLQLLLCEYDGDRRTPASSVSTGTPTACSPSATSLTRRPHPCTRTS